jgi:flavin reductase (DIM6/NTAB) family NADH-FMN oxidoreductase RutF
MTDVAAEFDALTSGLEYPMYVVTTVADGERSGCLAGFVTQCSISPPAMLVCISKANHTYRIAAAAAMLVVHLLGSDDEALARLFGERTGDDIDKFAQCSWRPGPGGVPVLDGCRGWLAGEVTSRTDVGDHVVFALSVSQAEARDPSAAQFGFRRATSFSPGHPA